MRRYVLRRLLESAVTFVLVTIVVFLGVRALPGDPARTLAGEESDPATVAQIRHEYLLDRPVLVQYARYVQKAITGDLGRSARTGLPVRSTIVHALPVTLQLATFAMLIAVFIGIGAGVLAAVIMRQTRSAMLEALSADYVRTARAKGLGGSRVVLGHALRNSLIVVVTIVGLQLGVLISGAVVTEQIFVLPGFGKLTLDAVFTRDYPMIQGVVLVTTTAYIGINLLVDLLYSVIDPRIRVGGAVL